MQKFYNWAKTQPSILSLTAINNNLPTPSLIPIKIYLIKSDDAVFTRNEWEPDIDRRV